MAEESERELRETAVILARWQGGIDQRLAALERHAVQLNGSVGEIEKDIRQIKIDLGVLNTKIAVWSGLGGVLGASIASAVVAVLLN